MPGLQQQYLLPPRHGIDVGMKILLIDGLRLFCMGG